MTPPTVIDPLEGKPKGVSVNLTEIAWLSRRSREVSLTDIIFQETMWRLAKRRQTFVSEYRAQPPGCYPW